MSNDTLTMEQLGQNYGFLLYRTKIPGSVKGSTANISIPGLRDRGVVFVNQVSCLFLFFVVFVFKFTLCESSYLLTREEIARLPSARARKGHFACVRQVNKGNSRGKIIIETDGIYFSSSLWFQFVVAFFSACVTCRSCPVLL